MSFLVSLYHRLLHCLVFKVQSFEILILLQCSVLKPALLVQLVLCSAQPSVTYIFALQITYRHDWLRSTAATDCCSAAKVALVEMRRIELLTPCLQGRCSPSWATPPNFTFGWPSVRLAMLLTTALYPTQAPSKVAPCLKSLRDVVSITRVLRIHKVNASGGPKWTRTTDLTLIRRAL